MDDVTEHGDETTERPEADRLAEAGTVWRVTLAWAVTSEAGRQERVDGLQQLLSARAVVGLMGPGRPTREGLVVDLVLPVSHTRIMVASRDGELEPGPDGEDFAWELHRYTGAVVVNGDLATGDFAVLASEDDLDDEALVRLLDEPLDSALLLGTVGTGTVEEVADRLGVSGWISDGDRPVFATQAPTADPTTLVMPGESDISVAVRERAGRVDLLVWGARPDGTAGRATRRRRAAQRLPVVATHLGARCRPVVLPEYKRPAGSPVSELLGRLEEDFAPLSSEALTALGRILPAAGVDALAHVVNEAPVRGLDPEDGVLAPEEDGLLPGEEPEPEEPRGAHADAEAVLSALGEDPAWLRLLVGEAPVGRGARPLGEALRASETGPATQNIALPDAAVPDAAGSAEAVEGRQGDHADGAAATTAPAGRQRTEPQQEPDQQQNADQQQPARQEATDQQSPAGRDAASIGPVLAPTADDMPTPDRAGDRAAAARLAAQDGGGGFASRIRRGPQSTPPTGFDDVLGTGAVRQVKPGQVETGRGGRKQAGQDRPGRNRATDGGAGEGTTDVPRPTPAAGTPASSAGDDSASRPRRVWPMVLLILGVVLIIGAAVLAWLVPGLEVSEGTAYVVAVAVAVIGLGAGIVGLTGLRR